jgi:glycerol-3-phosphate dehydrogenase subunit B
MSKSGTSVDLMVIGAGLAGLGAALFAAQRGLSVCLAGDTGGLDFHTGCLDLLGVHPMEEGRRREDPWQSLEELRAANPRHPYALIALETIRQAFYEFTVCLAQGGLLYQGHEGKNLKLLTSAGTLKYTYRAPHTMWTGARVMEERPPALLVDFAGMKEFNLAQAVEVRKADWPGLRHARLTLPEYRGDLHPEAMAWDLALAENRVKLAGRIKEQLRGEQAVGLPAVLGVQGTVTVKAHLEELLGVKVFEIPTPPPAIAGLRLRGVMEQVLASLGVRLLLKKRVTAFQVLNSGFRFQVSTGGEDQVLEAKGALLAGGRFIGKGLMSDRTHIREPLFSLPVQQPSGREDWHRQYFYDLRGHPVNQAGLVVDQKFRPLDESGRPAYENLFAAGTILAHQDWMRQKCGSGLALATALAAVEAFLGTIKAAT